MKVDEELNIAIDCLKKNDIDSAEKILLKSNNILENNTLKLKILSSIYYKKRNWIKFIEMNKNLLKKNYLVEKTLTNIGIGEYNLGKITNAINSFEKSIDILENNELALESLGICYMEKGELEKSLNIFNKVLSLNNKNTRIILLIINLLDFIRPKTNEENNVTVANNKILNLNNLFKKTVPKKNELKEILEKSFKYLNNSFDNIAYKQTQIFRRNHENLDCDRHFKVFNKFQIIPKFCFSCYKIQINLQNVVELIKLYFLFNKDLLDNSNLRKCMVEVRPNIKGNYKGFIYFKNPNDALFGKEILEKEIKENDVKIKSIEIKHGCSEFSEKYPKYKKINFNGDQEFKYEEKWNQFEKIIDNEKLKREKKDELYIGKTLNLFTISDALIIQNWLNYAKLLGDNSYENLFKHEIKDNFLKSVLKDQYNFRKSDFESD